MASRKERLQKQEKLDQQRSLKWRHEVQRIENKPFDVTFCHGEESIYRDRWKIMKDQVIQSSEPYWTFVKATTPEDAREYGVKIIHINSAPKHFRDYFKKNRLKICQSFKNVKFFSIRQSYITNDNKVYIFVDLCGFTSFLSKSLKNYPIESREIKVKTWGKSIAEGLAFLHNIGVAFGHNLTVDNLVADKIHAIKVFGLELFHPAYKTNGVKALCDVTDPNTQYTAPEAIKSKHDEICADIFRLGVILYYLMTDSFPFSDGQDSTQLENQMANKSWDNEKLTNPQLKDLLGTIFVADPVMRASIDEILPHQWFKI